MLLPSLFAPNLALARTQMSGVCVCKGVTCHHNTFASSLPDELCSPHAVCANGRLLHLLSFSIVDIDGTKTTADTTEVAPLFLNLQSQDVDILTATRIDNNLEQAFTWTRSFKEAITPQLSRRNRHHHRLSGHSDNETFVILKRST